MNLALLDTKILQLINQYSINGSIIPTNSGTIQDYLLRTRNLIDTCQKEIANIYPIIKETTYTQTRSAQPTDFASYALPSGLKNILSVTLQAYPKFKTIEYLRQGNNLLINPKLEGTIILKYSKNPDDITTSTDQNILLEIIPEAQELIPYYVAGHVYLEDNPTIATTLLNEYENKLAKIKFPSISTQNTILNGWNW